MAQLEFVIRAIDEATAQLESVSRSLQKVTDASKAQQAALQEQVRAASELGKAFAAAGAAITASLGGILVVARRYAEQVDKTAKTTGVAVETIQRLGFAAAQEHASLEALSTGMARLQRVMVEAATGNREAQRAFEALGVSVRDASGNLRPVEQVLLEVADRFARTEDASAKTALAFQLFGRSGAELVPFLSQGREAIEALGRSADNLGLVLSRDSVAALKSMGDAVDMARSAAQGLAAQIGAALAPAVTKLAQLVAAAVGTASRWVAENQQVARVLGVVAGAVGVVMLALGPLLMALPALVRGWELLRAGLLAFTAVIRLATGATLQFLAAWGPWIALAAAVAAAVAIIIRNLDNFGHALRGIAEMAKGFGQLLLGALTLDIGKIREGWDQISAGFGQLRQALAATAQRIAEDVGAAWQRVRSVFALPELPQVSQSLQTLGGAGIHLEKLASAADRTRRAKKELAQEVVDATNLINGVLVQQGKAWQGFASEAVRALGWLGQSTKETLAAAAGVVAAETARMQADLQASIQEVLNTIVPGLQRQGQAWQGLASEASRAAGWMGQSTRESAAAAQLALQQWDQYLQQRIAQMRHEVEVGRMTRDELVAQLRALLSSASLTAQQRMQVEAMLTSEYRRLADERVQALRHEVDMGRASVQEYVALLQQLLRDTQLTTQQRMQLERELVNTVLEAVQQRVQALQQEGQQAQQQAQLMQQVLNQLAQQWGLTAEQIAAVWAQLQERLARTNKKAQDDLVVLGQKLEQDLKPAFERFFTAVLTGSQSLQDALSQLGREILRALLEPLIQALAQVVAKWLAAAIASIWGSLIATYGIFAPLFVGIALALIAWATGLIKLAEGGLVTRPTLALVGERGPEAVVPLSRLGELRGDGRWNKEVVRRLDTLIGLMAERDRQEARQPPRVSMTDELVERELVLRSGRALLAWGTP